MAFFNNKVPQWKVFRTNKLVITNANNFSMPFIYSRLKANNSLPVPNPKEQSSFWHKRNTLYGTHYQTNQKHRLIYSKRTKLWAWTSPIKVTHIRTKDVKLEIKCKMMELTPRALYLGKGYWPKLRMESQISNCSVFSSVSALEFLGKLEAWKRG